MHPPLFVLGPGRSFSSVVCAMIGQHPEMYDLPEVNLFVADTVEGRNNHFISRHQASRLHGLIRTLAQLHSGEQTEAAADAAYKWLDNRKDMTIMELSHYLAQQFSDKRLVEKSPSNCDSTDNLRRMYRTFPDAFFLHLTRHPRTTGTSMYRVNLKRRERWVRRSNFYSNADPILLEKKWLTVHSNIFQFIDQLPPGQGMQIQGELLLSDPDRYLPQIAEWMGISSDPKSVECMRHPENSPYACYGPPNARWGTNPGFIEHPELRVGQMPEVSVEGEVDWLGEGKEFMASTKELARQLGYR